MKGVTQVSPDERTDYNLCRQVLRRIAKKAKGLANLDKHHVVRVADNMDWHLDNLDLGWLTQVDLDSQEHELVHSNVAWDHGQITTNYNKALQCAVSWN